MERRSLLCFGVGYTASALVELLGKEHWRFAGTTRDAGSMATLRQRGFDARPFDRTRPLADAGSLLTDADCLLSSVPPDAEGDPVLDLHADVIAAAASSLRWVGYLSTTGVYGDTGGAWVDEASPLRPSGERAARRMAAEAGWLELGRRYGIPVHIFRLSGIYGPGRSSLDALRAGRARRIFKPGQVFSRIHVEDIARVLRASIDHPYPGAVYNVCDDEPAPSSDVVAFAAELLGIPAPPLVPFDEADLSSMARSFYADNRRVRNDRIKQELGVELLYPSYREGLRACLEADRQRGRLTVSDNSATVAQSRSRS